MSQMLYDGNGNPIQVTDEYNIPIVTGDLPTVFITSDTAYSSLTKETAVNGEISFIDWKSKFSLPIKIKLQGNHSLDYAKKNLNVTFYNNGSKQKIKFNSWYPTNKVHIKANEFDYSMCRNSVGTKLAYDLCGKYLPTGARGYIDSFPVIVYYNNEYIGCHTFNLPQDGKTYNFKDSKETAGTNLAYRTKDATNNWKTSSFWEYRGDADENATMRNVFDTTVIPALNNASLTKADIEAHFDVNTMIAYLAFAQIACAVDSMTNNWTLITWDGNIWYHTWYDLDICFGLGGWQDGTNISSTKDVFTSVQGAWNSFFQQVKTLYISELEATYADMRNHGADTDTIVSAFVDFQNRWGQTNIIADRVKWSSDKPNSNDITNLRTWLTERFTYLDNLYNY